MYQAVDLWVVTSCLVTSLCCLVRPHSLGTSLQKYLNSAYKYCPRKLKPTVVVMLLENTGIHTETASALTCHSIQGEVFQTRS